MAVSFKIKATGPLYGKPERYVKFAITRALKLTADTGKEWVQLATPVKTGLLQSKWSARKSKWNEFSLKNEVTYAPYVEGRFRMLERNEGRIQEELAKNLEVEIAKALN